MAPDSSSGTGQRTRRVIAAVLAGALILVAAFAAGRISAPQTGTPGNTSVEAGFARDMQTHHEQAVEMAMMVRDLTDDANVRTLAYDIATSQSNQSGQLYGWLTEWNLPQASPEPSMTWMSAPTLAGASGHNMDMGGGSDGSGTSTGAGATSTPAASHTPGGTMPGLATPAQMKKLATLKGVAAERMFLTLMIAHHKGGVEMAQALLDRSDYRVTADFARAVIYAQTSEIQMMEDMLKKRSS